MELKQNEKYRKYLERLRNDPHNSVYAHKVRKYAPLNGGSNTQQLVDKINKMLSNVSQKGGNDDEMVRVRATHAEDMGKLNTLKTSIQNKMNDRKTTQQQQTEIAAQLATVTGALEKCGAEKEKLTNFNSELIQMKEEYKKEAEILFGLYPE
jgi:hypothetical protein